MCALAKQSPFIHARPPAHIAIHGDASPSKHTPAASAAHSESSSVLALRQKGQESAQVGALPARNGSPVATSHRPGTPIATTNSNPAKIRNFFTNLSVYIRAEFSCLRILTSSKVLAARVALSHSCHQGEFGTEPALTSCA